MTNERMKTRAFLIFCVVGLVPIALGYGAKPSVSLDILFGITVDTTNLTHIMRAVMGLYLGMAVLWLWGAFRKFMEGPALIACAVFMLGLAAGRILSFIIDGMPHWLLIIYAVLEIVLGLIAVILYRANRQEPRCPEGK
jgi:amino acid transporter